MRRGREAGSKGRGQLGGGAGRNMKDAGRELFVSLSQEILLDQPGSKLLGLRSLPRTEGRENTLEVVLLSLTPLSLSPSFHWIL